VQNPIIHRDLKLDNILLSHNGQRPVAKLVDFGLSAVRLSCTTTACLQRTRCPLVSLGSADSRMQNIATALPLTDVYPLGRRGTPAPQHIKTPASTETLFGLMCCRSSRTTTSLCISHSHVWSTTVLKICRLRHTATPCTLSSLWLGCNHASATGSCRWN
jgi:serine/threonine protein kinase